MELSPFTARLLAATNDHDVDGIVACFTDDYENLTPCHPGRGFHGRDQVRQNWTGMLAEMPDLQAAVVASSSDDGVEWTEWEMRGTRRDGSAHHLRGVIVFAVDDDVATGCRFYLEPVGP